MRLDGKIGKAELFVSNLESSSVDIVILKGGCIHVLNDMVHLGIGHIVFREKA